MGSPDIIFIIPPKYTQTYKSKVGYVAFKHNWLPKETAVLKFHPIGLAVVLFSVGALFSACGHHGMAALPQTNAIARPAGQAMSPSADFYANIILTGKSPDGKYAFRTLHASGVRVHQAFAFKTAFGIVTQVEYTTPYGPLDVVQTPKLTATPPPPPADKLGRAIISPLIASGTTVHGARWFISRDAASQYDLDVEFSDSSIGVKLPHVLSLAAIEYAIGGLY